METGIVVLRESDESLLDGYGTNAQEEKARTWATKRGIGVAGIEVVVETARKWERGKFDEVIQKCIQRHHTEGVKWVVFGRVDRGARKQLIFGYYVGWLCKEGMEVAFALEDITTADPPEKGLFLSFHAYRAQVDGDNTVSSLWDGRLRRAKEDGRFASYDGGLWPYRYIPSRKKKGGAVREKVPERVEWCRRWYEWLKGGMKGNQMAERMNQSPVPPPRGKRWTRHTIFGILKNKGLRGKATWNGIPLSPDASPAIFTEDEGEEIDRLINANIEKSRRNAHEDYELSGHVSCECGAPVWGRRNKIRDHLYIRYQCPRCGRYVEKVCLEALVKTKVLPLFTDPGWLRTYVDEHKRDDSGEHKEHLERLDKEINRWLTYVHNLKRQHAWGDWTDNEYCRERDKVNAELERLRAEKAEAERAYSMCIDAVRDAEALESIADQIHERLLLDNSAALSQIYDALKLNVTLTSEGVAINALVPLETFDVAAITSPRYSPQGLSDTPPSLYALA